MRISDWSSDVCSSDLDLGLVDLPGRPATYAEWDAIDMAALFAEPFDLPVFVENDAAAAAMGEMQLGVGQTLSSFLYRLHSAGLGGGVVVEGAYFLGAAERLWELGGSGGRRVGKEGGCSCRSGGSRE